MRAARAEDLSSTVGHTAPVHPDPPFICALVHRTVDALTKEVHLVAAEALEQSVLENKDKDQLLAIAKALGLKATSRTKKSDIIDSILETTGSTPAPAVPAAPAVNGDAPEVAALFHDAGDHGTNDTAQVNGSAPTTDDPADAAPSEDAPGAAAGDSAPVVLLDADGEPLAEWELELAALGDSAETTHAVAAPSAPSAPSAPTAPAMPAAQNGAQPRSEAQGGGQQAHGAQQIPAVDDGESRNRRRRRRRKGGRGDGPQGDDSAIIEASVAVAVDTDPQQAPSSELVPVEGYLDMRDEGYGFLRVNGYLPSREDAYIPVKLARQYGLRKGDHITGTSRPAGRNEKNPALLDVLTVNGGDPEAARRRPRFEDLTALFPDSNLRLEDPDDPTNMTARIIDLVSPIGKGQRGIIVSPPKAGKTTIMKTIAKSIEQNNPDVKLIVLLIDERPEEVTDMRRHVQHGEVIASTFDRPSDEHTHVAELAIEKAKRMVEQGDDVVVILDGITRLSRAYNLAAPASGRILSGGIDAGALYPPKKFFGAARNVEEGGSLTILATALVETNSRMDEAIFEEFKGTGNMELRLDRRLSERRIYPAIDVDASSTRHEELLFDRKQLQMVWKLRRVLSGLAADGNAAPGLELLIDRLKTFRTNAEFLNEIGKQPGM
jgi:transcription termination factor Rho